MYGLAGRNGSVKSTLLKIISGLLSSSKGEVRFESEGNIIPRDQCYQYLSYAAPYFELIEELTLEEYFKFYLKSSKTDSPGELDKWLHASGLAHESKKQLQNFSSGMKQRVKLSAALMSKKQLVLLDEPSSNLDSDAYEWYRKLLKECSQRSLVIVASNDEQDFTDLKDQIRMENFKR